MSGSQDGTRVNLRYAARAAYSSGASHALTWVPMSTTPSMRRLASRTERELLAILQDFQCAICGSDLAGGYECDHLVPYSKGGQTTLENLQALCLDCHSDKTRGEASGR